jgi:indolepyruvate ferredoxin oxidoreductase, alpha subunit
MCQGIEFDEDKYPHFTLLCTNCAGQGSGLYAGLPFRCDRIYYRRRKIKIGTRPSRMLQNRHYDKDRSRNLPSSLRVAVRGIGGQGNLFLGKVLAEVALNTPYSK